MTTPEKNLVAAKAIADARAAEAKAKLQQTQVEVKKTQADRVATSPLTVARERVKKDIAGVKEFAAADLARTKADFKRVNDRLAAWDAATSRNFDARLDEADAQIAVWKASANAKRAEQAIQRHDDFATLEETIALARATAAEAKHATYAAKAQTALDDAARAFDEAYDAAAKRYAQGGVTWPTSS